MAIITGLSVSVFNILKYFFIVIFTETIARGALKTFHVFLRRFDLYKGRGTPLSRSRIDRYNLFQVRGKRSFVRILFWTLLVTCLYAVEILFEFSSGAVEQVTVRPERRYVYNATYGACGSMDVLRSFVARRMAEMASSCVDLTETNYTLYKPLWVRGQSRATQAALCVKVPQNVLQRGERLYKDRRFTEGTPAWDAVSGLIAAVKSNAWNTGDTKNRTLAVISVSSSNILYTESVTPGNPSYQVALLVVHIPSRPGARSACGGIIIGAVGEGVMRVRLTACVESSASGLHFLQIYGTAPVFLDAALIQEGQWNASVVVYFGIAIRNFTKGIFEPSENINISRVLAYAGLLSAANAKDPSSLNKYAALYKHCNLFSVAQEWDRAQWLDVEYGNLDVNITGTLSEWALILVISWSIALWVTAFCLLKFADHKGMPTNVTGEIDIARRWAAHEGIMVSPVDTEHRSPSTKKPRTCLCSNASQIYLNVEIEQECDDVVAGRTPLQIARDTSKSFKEV